jgi:uncharacterized RDD family membrane protein YckC
MSSSPRSRPEPAESSDVAIGIAATAARIAQVTLRPARVLARAVLARPAFRGGVDALASAGRDAEAESRRRLEAAVSRVLSAPESARTIDRALAGPVPEALSEETIERLGRRVIESPAFEQLLREAVASGMARELADEALKSPDLQRMLEDVLSGPVVRNVIARQTTTLWSEVAARIRATASAADDRIEGLMHRLFRREPRAAAALRYAGLVSRGAAVLADAALAHLVTLLIGVGFALVAWLAGVDSPRVLGPVAGGGWLVVVGAYFVFFWSTAGQTPGMRALRLRVTTDGGGPPRARRALLRFVVGVLTLAPLGIGLIPVLFDARRRAVHDFAARTVVVHDAAAESVP